MHLKTTAAALTAGLAVAAAPALAAHSSAGQAHGHATSPAQICKAMTPALSHKKGATDQKSPFAACVVGATRMQKQLRSTTTTNTTTTDTTTTQTNTTSQSPAKICKAVTPALSHKKSNHGKGKSPFAACVSGAAKAQQDAQGSDDGDTTTQTTTTTTQGS